MVKACLKNSSLFIRPLRARVPLKMFPGKTKKQFKKDLNKKSQVTTWPLDQPPLQLRKAAGQRRKSWPGFSLVKTYPSDAGKSSMRWLLVAWLEPLASQR